MNTNIGEKKDLFFLSVLFDPWFAFSFHIGPCFPFETQIFRSGDFNRRRSLPASGGILLSVQRLKSPFRSVLLEKETGSLFLYVFSLRLFRVHFLGPAVFYSCI